MDACIDADNSQKQMVYRVCVNRDLRKCYLVSCCSVDVEMKCSEANEENVLLLIYTNPIPYKVMPPKLRKPNLNKHNLISF